MSESGASKRLAPVISLPAWRRKQTEAIERPANLHWLAAEAEAQVGLDPGLVVLMHSPLEKEARGPRPRPCAGVLLSGVDVCQIAALFAHYPEPDATLPFEISRGGVWVNITRVGTDATGQIYASTCGLVGESRAYYRIFIAERRLLKACLELRASIRTHIPLNSDIEDLLLYLDTRISTLDLIARHMP